MARTDEASERAPLDGATERMSLPERASLPDRVSLLDSALGDDVGFLLARVSAWVSAHGNRSLEALDLNVRSYSVLALSCGGAAPTQRECADFLSLDPSRVVALIDDLERRDLVRRVPSERDRRTNSIQATSEGRALFAAARAAVRSAEERALQHLADGDVTRLRADLRTAAGFDQKDAI